MPTRNASAVWNGTLTDGNGHVTFGKTKLNYSFPSRFEDGDGSNPEELLGAAHAGCIAMALAHELSENGFEVHAIDAEAAVKLDQIGDDFAITNIDLKVRGNVSEIDEETFVKHAEAAKAGCPVSKALAGVEISIEAELVT